MKRTPMEMSCWRGRQRGTGVKLVSWLFVKQEHKWLLRKRKPFLFRWPLEFRVTYSPVVHFSSVYDPMKW